MTANLFSEISLPNVFTQVRKEVVQSHKALEMQASH